MRPCPRSLSDRRTPPHSPPSPARQADIGAETTAVSKWHFALMALLDTCAMLLTVIPGGRVPAPLTVLLLQVRRRCAALEPPCAQTRYGGLPPPG